MRRLEFLENLICLPASALWISVKAEMSVVVRGTVVHPRKCSGAFIRVAQCWVMPPEFVQRVADSGHRSNLVRVILSGGGSHFRLTLQRRLRLQGNLSIRGRSGIRRMGMGLATPRLPHYKSRPVRHLRLELISHDSGHGLPA